LPKHDVYRTVKNNTKK